MREAEKKLSRCAVEVGMYHVIKNYRDDAELRQSFNKLAERTFGLDFEDWYQNGFWGDSYDPHSVVIDGQVAANVSVNLTEMLFDGVPKRFLQLGTVMTDERYRGRGLCRTLMEYIEAEYRGKTDGVYLFANDSVTEFYPKFGFRKAVEYQYSKHVENTGGCQLERVPMNGPAAWDALEAAIRGNRFWGRFDMVNNPELILFYVTKYMQENVFYHKATGTYVIAEQENGRLFLHNVFSSRLTDPDEAAALFGAQIREVVLGFAPKESEGWTAAELAEEDSTFFVKGSEWERFEKEKLRIPSLSHA